MARHPDWYKRLDDIRHVLRQAGNVEWLGRSEIKAIFGCSERDSIRLLHKFGAQQWNNALSLPRPSLLAQLDALHSSQTYAAFLRQKHDVARQLTAARAEASTRQFLVKPGRLGEPQTRLEDLPPTITWRRTASNEPGRLEILYNDGADLMSQLADFLSAVGVNRDEFFAGTEPPDAAGR